MCHEGFGTFGKYGNQEGAGGGVKLIWDTSAN